MYYYEFLSKQEEDSLKNKKNISLVNIKRELLNKETNLFNFFTEMYRYSNLSKKNWNIVTGEFTHEGYFEDKILVIMHDADITAQDLLNKDLESYFFTIFASLDFHFSKKKGYSCMRDDIHFRVAFVYKDEQDKKEKEIALEEVKKNINWEYYA